MLNSLSKVLSTNGHLFASGLTVKGSHGWWGLHTWEAPKPAASAIPKDSKPVTVLKRSFETMQRPPVSQELFTNASIHAESDIEVEKDYSSDDDGDDDDDNEKQPAARPTPSVELKQQLLERLLMMDSSILAEAIKKAKAKKLQDEAREKKVKQQRQKTPKVETISQYRPSASDEHAMHKPKTVQLMPFLKPFLLETTTNLMLNRAGPHENDLLKRCEQTTRRPKVISRLLRKLIMRRQKRKAQLPFFDLDHWMYMYLKSSEEPLVLQKAAVTSAETAPSPTPAAQSLQATFNPEEIPYIVDPSRSMYAKLTGMASLYGQVPYPVTSPFTGRLLEPFVWRDDSFTCPKMELLKEIRDFGGIPDNAAGPEDGDDSDAEEEEKLQESLDFVHLRKEFVGQCNDLLALSFWPNIDVSEALDYPDYTMLALYRHAVVACAFITPDGYLSYLHVRPDFQGHKIANKLLSLLLPVVSPRKDITLHVSVTNAPAILLYQQFGFKPEEFIVNFYEKYYPEDYKEQSKNAFLMRLKR